MLVLLPPSETKAAGGDGPPLDVTGLSFPELNPTRRTLVDAVTTLATDVAASRLVLGLSARQDEEIARNAQLLRSPTVPALCRYTGVLFDALDVGSLTTAQFRQANQRLVVASALFGLVRPADPIPAYRLSGDCRLPGFPTLRRVWRPAAEPVLAKETGLVVDLRSAGYAALARVPAAVTVRVLAGRPSGARTAVSHHNKFHKGLLARVLAVSRREPRTPTDIIAIATAGGLAIEQTGPNTLVLIT